MPLVRSSSGLEKGTVDRSTLAADFNDYLTPAKVSAARQALNALGPIKNIRVGGTGERGGSEVTTILFDAGTTPARAVMFRTPNGKVEQFLLSRN